MENMTSLDGQPAPLHTITTLEALKVFSDPLRQQIIESLLDGAKTVKQVAAELDLAPTKLYYHVNLLEEHGLIRVTETRIVSGIIEKHYIAAAREYKIERSLLTPGGGGGDEVLEAVFSAMIDPIRTDVHRSMAQGLLDFSDDAPAQRKFRMWRATSRLSPEQAEAFYARLQALVDEFNGFRENSDEPHFGMLITIYPTPTPPPKKSPKS
jgi:transposase-like protein